MKTIYSVIVAIIFSCFVPVRMQGQNEFTLDSIKSNPNFKVTISSKNDSLIIKSKVGYTDLQLSDKKSEGSFITRKINQNTYVFFIGELIRDESSYGQKLEVGLGYKQGNSNKQASFLIEIQKIGDRKISLPQLMKSEDMIPIYAVRTLSNAAINDSNAVYLILSYYTGKTPEYFTKRGATFGNPFLESFLTGFHNLIDHPSKGIATPSGSFDMGSSIMNTDVTAFADGLAQFMVSRAKEELNLAFFERFKEILQNSKYSSDLQILFPDTYLCLMRIDQNIYQLNNYIQVLREAMQHDLSRLFDHVNTFIYQKKFEPFFEKYPEIEIIVKYGMKTANGILQKQHPGEIIHSLAEVPVGKNPFCQNFSSGMKFFDFFSQSIRNKDPKTGYWVRPTMVCDTILKDPSSLKLYLGIIYEELKQHDIKFFDKDNKQIYSLANAILSLSLKNYDISSIDLYVTNLIQTTESMSNMVSEVKQRAQKNENAGFNDYYRLYNASLDILVALFDVSKLPKSNLTVQISTIRMGSYFSIARQGGNIAVNVKNKEYASAVINLATLVDSIFTVTNSSSRIENIIKQIIALMDGTELLRNTDVKKKMFAALNGYLKEPSEANYEALQSTIPGILTDLQTSYRLQLNKSSISDKAKIQQLSHAINAVDTLKSYFESLKAVICLPNLSNLIELTIKYGTFAANMVRAQSPEEVKAALEAAALPVGSYRIKRQSLVNISINGFVGLTYGIQLENHKGISVLGAWAPVGPAFSFGKFWYCKKKASSFSIFIPVIDVGALALFRVSGDSSEVKNKITLNQILSPGLILSYGFPGVPINLSLGYQLPPLLQSVSTEQLVLNNKNSGRFMVSLSVDIPFFNLYTSTDSKSKTFQIENGKLVSKNLK